MEYDGILMNRSVVIDNVSSIYQMFLIKIININFLHFCYKNEN